MLAALGLALKHFPQLGHGKVGGHLLDIAFDAALRVVLHHHPCLGQDAGVQFGFARAVTAHGVDVHARLNHLRRQDGGLGFVSGQGGDDVGPLNGLSH